MRYCNAEPRKIRYSITAHIVGPIGAGGRIGLEPSRAAYQHFRDAHHIFWRETAPS